MRFKVTRIVCFSMLMILMLSACGSKAKDAKITVSSSNWSGFEGGHVSEGEDQSYTVKVGDSIELGGCCNLIIKIVKISDDEVTIETNTPMSDHDDGTINLNTDQTKFTILRDNQLHLATPTMDAGDSYILGLE